MDLQKIRGSATQGLLQSDGPRVLSVGMYSILGKVFVFGGLEFTWGFASTADLEYRGFDLKFYKPFFPMFCHDLLARTISKQAPQKEGQASRSPLMLRDWLVVSRGIGEHDPM